MDDNLNNRPRRSSRRRARSTTESERYNESNKGENGSNDKEEVEVNYNLLDKRQQQSSSSGNNNDNTSSNKGSNRPLRRGPSLRPRDFKDRPVLQITEGIVDLYQLINDRYYAERDEQQQLNNRPVKGSLVDRNNAGHGGVYNDGYDDENHDYIVREGELILNRYKVGRKIGKGSFGRVVRGKDLRNIRQQNGRRSMSSKSNNSKVNDEAVYEDVAIKIIKNRDAFTKQAQSEIAILQLLQTEDPDKGKRYIVKLKDYFMHRNHQCLVFELLSTNLYEFLKANNHEGCSLRLTRKFAIQILEALAYLDRCNIMHCDLKPENILLCHHRRNEIKIIDFGSSVRDNKAPHQYIQSRFYRAPEVLLCLRYNNAIDMWSAGCILAELHTGDPLFCGSDQIDQMHKIIRLLGMPEKEFIDRSDYHRHSHEFFRKDRNDGSYSIKPHPIRPVQLDTDVTKITPDKARTNLFDAVAKQAETREEQAQYNWFVDLLYEMLVYFPENRIRPLQALKHRFITSEGLFENKE